MDIFLKDKIKRVHEFIIHLYNLKKQDGTLKEIALKMQSYASFQNWAKELKDFEIEEIIEAINKFHREKNNNTPPKIYQIVSILNQKRNIDSIKEYELNKPICRISEWQSDFDYVLKQACIYEIVYNPYWVNMGCKPSVNSKIIEKNGTILIKTYKSIWNEALLKAKEDHKQKFLDIAQYNDWILEFTLAYRLGYLKL